MEVLYLLIPIALIFVALMAVAVVWAISSGQYDDLERAGEEVLLDDDDEIGTGDRAARFGERKSGS